MEEHMEVGKIHSNVKLIRKKNKQISEQYQCTTGMGKDKKI